MISCSVSFICCGEPFCGSPAGWHHGFLSPRISQRSDDLYRGVVPADIRKRASSTAAQLAFSHLTICSFLPVKRHPDAPSALPTGVVVPFTRTTKAMQDAWPGAVIRANSGGSISAAIFAEFVEACWLLPMRKFPLIAMIFPPARAERSGFNSGAVSSARGTFACLTCELL